MASIELYLSSEFYAKHPSFVKVMNSHSGVFNDFDTLLSLSVSHGALDSGKTNMELVKEEALNTPRHWHSIPLDTGTQYPSTLAESWPWGRQIDKKIVIIDSEVCLRTFRGMLLKIMEIFNKLPGSLDFVLICEILIVSLSNFAVNLLQNNRKKRLLCKFFEESCFCAAAYH